MGYHGFSGFGAVVPPGDTWPQGPTGPVQRAPTPKPAPRPAPPRPAGPKKPYVRPDQGMPIEMVICAGKPDYIVSRFIYNQWSLRDDMWERHRCMLHCVAKDVIDSWMDMRARKIHHICLMGHTDFTGPDDYNMQLGRARANSVRDALCQMLIYHAQCHQRLDIVTNITIAAGTAGKTAPRVPGRSDESRERNRRVEIYFVYQPTTDGRKCPINIPIPRRPQPPPGPIFV